MSVLANSFERNAFELRPSPTVGHAEKRRAVAPPLQLAAERANRVDMAWEGWGNQRESVDLHHTSLKGAAAL